MLCNLRAAGTALAEERRQDGPRLTRLGQFGNVFTPARPRRSRDTFTRHVVAVQAGTRANGAKKLFL